MTVKVQPLPSSRETLDGNFIKDEIIGEHLKKSLLDISDYEVSFNKSRFFKFFLYHILSIYAFPLVYIVVPFF